MADQDTTTGAAGSPATEQAAAQTFDWESLGEAESKAAQEAAEAAATAAEQAKQQEETAAAAEEEKIKGDPDHPRNLGRKVKELSEKFDAFLTAQQQSGGQLAAQPAEVADRFSEDLFERMNSVEPCPVEFVTTAREQFLVQQWERRVQQRLVTEDQSRYAKAYLDQIKKMADEGGELHARIVHMIAEDEASPFNRRVRGIGDVDAELNYHRAHKALLAGKEKPDAAAGKFAQQSAVGSGVTQPSGAAASAVEAPKLSVEAQSYADYLGMSNEDRQDALKRRVVISGSR